MANPQANKAVVRQFIERIFGAGDTTAVDELIAPTAAFHTYRFDGDPRAGMRAAIERMSTALSDGSFTIRQLIAEDDLVCAHVTSAATQSGPFMGMPASGRRYEIDELHLFRVRDGQVVEHWHQYDQMGMLRQLGIGPGA